MYIDTDIIRANGILIPMEEYKELLQIKGKFDLINENKLFNDSDYKKCEESKSEKQVNFDKDVYKLYSYLLDSILNDNRLKKDGIIIDKYYIDKLNRSDNMLFEVCNCLNGYFMLTSYKDKYNFSCCLEKGKQYLIRYRIEVINNEIK